MQVGVLNRQLGPGVWSSGERLGLKTLQSGDHKLFKTWGMEEGAQVREGSGGRNELEQPRDWQVGRSEKGGGKENVRLQGTETGW